MSTPPRAYGWMYVFYHADDQVTNIERLKTLTCRYHVIGYQQDELGQPLVVGFIYFKNRRSWKGVRRFLWCNHVEKQRWLTTFCADFCKRSDKYWEQGKPPQDRTSKYVLIPSLESIKSAYGTTTNVPLLRNIIPCGCYTCKYKKKQQALKDKQSKSV